MAALQGARIAGSVGRRQRDVAGQARVVRDGQIQSGRALGGRDAGFLIRLDELVGRELLVAAAGRGGQNLLDLRPAVDLAHGPDTGAGRIGGRVGRVDAFQRERGAGGRLDTRDLAVEAGPAGRDLDEIAGAVALDAADDGSAGDAAVAAHLDDGCVERPTVPLVGT